MKERTVVGKAGRDGLPVDFPRHALLPSTALWYAQSSLPEHTGPSFLANSDL